jgi:hypothetical protein
MRLLRLSDVDPRRLDRVFYYSRVRALVFAFVALGAGATLLLRAASPHWNAGYYLAAVILLFVLLLKRFVTARFRPSNWIPWSHTRGSQTSKPGDAWSTANLLTRICVVYRNIGISRHSGFEPEGSEVRAPQDVPLSSSSGVERHRKLDHWVWATLSSQTFPAQINTIR